MSTTKLNVVNDTPLPMFIGASPTVNAFAANGALQFGLAPMARRRTRHGPDRLFQA